MPRDPDITRIDYDSRQVKPGSLFVAIIGEVTDGHKYISRAFQQGAEAVVVQRKTSELKGRDYLHVSDSRSAIALLASELHGQPDRALSLVGVTGTNGKTTTVSILGEVFKAAYGNSGVIGTLGGSIGDKTFSLERTTPEAPDVFALLNKMKHAGCTAVAMEVSSHALTLDRVYGMHFHTAAFTNLSQDHLDFHDDIESYFNVKAELFRSYSVGTAVVNTDDVFGERLIGLSKAPVLTYSLKSDTDVKATSLDIDQNGIRMTAATPRGRLDLVSPLLGRFNAYNLICALTVSETLEIDHDKFIEGASRFKGVPGRMELFDLGDRRAYVDYAHTPEALELALRELRNISAGEVHVLFGCGGNRDRDKRPKMGRAAEMYADKVYVTTDNPRDEDAEAITDEIMKGIEDLHYIERIPDRRKAISLALEKLPERGALLIAGKGHENYQEIKGVKHPLDDREEVRKYMDGLAI